MSNVHGLFSGKKDDSDDEDAHNSRYVGGIDSRGGGSGLAVEPSHDDDDADADGDDAQHHAGSIFGRAEQATDADASSSNTRRRTITMYRDGFVVDDGPYRRLDDPANKEFLRSLAAGRTPRELLQQDDNINQDESGSGGDVVVNLLDKRNQDYVEEFRSFSGAGTSLGSGSGGSASQEQGGVFAPTVPPATLPTGNSSPTTQIQVRLLNGQRQVVRVHLDTTIAQLASMLDSQGESFRLVSGFPPKPLTEGTVKENGLKGAQVVMKKA